MNVAKKIKITLHVFAVLGLLLTLGNVLGWFQDKSRMDVYNGLIHEPYRMEIAHGGVRDFINDFYNPEKASSEIRELQILGIESSRISIGDNRPVSGAVHLWLEGGKQSTAIINLDELSDWANETPFYNWSALIILFIGVFGNILVEVLSWRFKRSYVEI